MQLDLDPREVPEPDAPNIPLWTENYVYEVNCPDANVGFFLHLGRQSFNTDLWRDTFIADVGGEEVFLWKGFGKGGDRCGPGGSQLRFRCHESFQRWTLEFDGAAQRVPRKLVNFGAGGALRDGPVVPVRMHMDMVSDSPVWDLSEDIATHSWGKIHYQQSMRVASGELVANGQSFALSGVATRDHTRGARDFGGLGSYAFVHGGFPGGRRFIAMAMDSRTGFGQPPVRLAMLADGDQLQQVDILETSIPTTPDGSPQRFTLRLKGPAGIETLYAERQSTVVISIGAPNEFLLGPSTEPVTRAHLFASPTRFTWNGETCYGYSERTVAVGDA